MSGAPSICWHCGEAIGTEYVTTYLEAPLGDEKKAAWIALHPKCAEGLVMYLSIQLDEARVRQRKANFNSELTAIAGHA